jgi:hypothetical protein
LLEQWLQGVPVLNAFELKLVSILGTVMEPSSDSTVNEVQAVRALPYDVFLSHHGADKALVEALAERLEDEAGLKPFLDKWRLVPGDPWQEGIEQALNDSAACAVFLGPSGLGPWHNQEMRAALDKRIRSRLFRVVPVLLPGAEPTDPRTLPSLLSNLSWVDFRTGLDDEEAFHRLVAGIKGIAPGRRTHSPAPALAPSGSLRPKTALASGRAEQGTGSARENNGGDLWKIIVAAVLALILGVPFISGAIPKYKLQIKSPAHRKDGIYQAPAGAVTIAWAMSKEQWFREIDLGDAEANVTIKLLPDGPSQPSFENASGEVQPILGAGRYEVRVESVEHNRFETIALEVSHGQPPHSTAELTGTVIERAPGGHPIQGALVTVDEAPGMKPAETSSDGVFIIDSVPRAYGEMVRIRVVKDGYEPNPWTEDVKVGATPPRIELRRTK